MSFWATSRVIYPNGVPPLKISVKPWNFPLKGNTPPSAFTSCEVLDRVASGGCENELAEAGENSPGCEGQVYGGKASGFSSPASCPKTSSVPEPTTTARRPTDVNGQLCESYYYSAMQHLLGATSRASNLFHKCIDTDETDFTEYRSAVAELDHLKDP